MPMRLESTMKKKTDNDSDKYPDDWEPPWMNPANDRQTPYTEEELELFAKDFIVRMSDVEKLKHMVEKEGLDRVKEIVKEGFRNQDENSLVNINFEGSIH
jgi:hypothetical protein